MECDGGMAHGGPRGPGSLYVMPGKCHFDESKRTIDAECCCKTYNQQNSLCQLYGACSVSISFAMKFYA